MLTNLNTNPTNKNIIKEYKYIVYCSYFILKGVTDKEVEIMIN